MLRILIKNAFLNGLGFGFAMSILALIKGRFGILEIIGMSVLFGIGMAIILNYQLKSELNKRGINNISNAEIEELTENATVQIEDVAKAIEHITSDGLKYKVKVDHSNGRIIVSPLSKYSEWRDPIHLIQTDKQGEYSMKAKRRFLSPDLYYYLNAFNIKEIKALLQ